LTPAEIEAWKKTMDLHHKQHQAERVKFRKHKRKAKSYPSKYACISVDGMDSSKTHLPRTRMRNKETADKTRLRTHVIGALVYGLHQPASCYVHCDSFQQDSNMTIEVLLRCIGRLPHIGSDVTLYLQFDNCWRDNKNQVFI
jgi:hypothetical protein